MGSVVRHWIGIVALAAVGCSLDSVEGGEDPDPDPPDPTVDAGPQFACYSDYEAAGDIAHTVAPVAGESCNGDGAWTITIDNAVAGEGETACASAPATLTFNLQVDHVERGGTVIDQDDGARTWTLQMADKGGSCSGTFTYDAADGSSWAISVTENGQDGPLDGQANYTEPR